MARRDTRVAECRDGAERVAESVRHGELRARPRAEELAIATARREIEAKLQSTKRRLRWASPQIGLTIKADN